MRHIKQTYFIKASVEKVWQALTTPKHINAWGGGQAKMDDKVGTEFSFWGGDIWGTNKEVVQNKKLVQEWYGGDWPKPSIAIFTLTKEKAGTKLLLPHTGVPADEVKNFADGWKDYFLRPLKQYVETNR